MKIKIVLFLTLLLIAGCVTVTKKEALKEYKKKRELSRSPEPSGKVTSKKTDKNIFVIQKHDSSRLHYDLRLEINGVLVSWAVPKGPSLNPKDKRLAIQTDDHPLDYATFEGVIPESNYGAGTVMVWDIGTYKNIKTKGGKLIPIEQCLKNGQIEVWLEGKKLTGGFALIKMQDRENQWLLIKMKDEYASARNNPVNTKTKSALTGRTLYQIKKAG